MPPLNFLAPAQKIVDHGHFKCCICINGSCPLVNCLPPSDAGLCLRGWMSKSPLSFGRLVALVQKYIYGTYLLPIFIEAKRPYLETDSLFILSAYGAQCSVPSVTAYFHTVADRQKTPRDKLETNLSGRTAQMK